MKILVIGPSWIGDMMMSQMLYRALKLHHTKAVIDVLAPEWSRPLLSRMKEINESILLPINHGVLDLKKRFQLGLELRKKKYDRAYILPNSFKSALIPFFAGIPHRIGWRGEMRYGLINDMRILNEKLWPLMGERYLALAYKKDIIQSSTNLSTSLFWPTIQVFNNERFKLYSKFRLFLKRKIIGLCPGTGSNLQKCWPCYHFASLAKKLINDENYQVVLLGSKKDSEISDKIYSSLTLKEQKWCLNLTGKTTLDQAIILITICKAVITNDSGLMHISAALKQPMIVLYGPSSPNFTPPLSKKARVICSIYSNLHNTLMKSKNDKKKYHQSLINIAPQQVLNELHYLLD